jgi:hypothetical protein
MTASGFPAKRYAENSRVNICLRVWALQILQCPAPVLNAFADVAGKIKKVQKSSLKKRFQYLFTLNQRAASL